MPEWAPNSILELWKLKSYYSGIFWFRPKYSRILDTFVRNLLNRSVSGGYTFVSFLKREKRVGVPCLECGFHLHKFIIHFDWFFDDVSYFRTCFRSRPVVRLRNKLTFPTGKLVSLDNKKCTLRDGTQVACLPLSLCMSYDGFGVDDTIGMCGEDPRNFFCTYHKHLLGILAMDFLP